MMLNSIEKIGDVILVADENVIEDIDVEAYSNLIGSEVITETGELLGKVRGFKFNVETGELYSLIIASLGIPQIPEQMLSTYEVPIDEIVSSGPNRLIVFEGAQDRLTQLSVGVMERLGIGEAPWEKDREEEFLTPKIRIDNQLGTGTTSPEPEPVRAPARVVEQAWSEDEWDEPEPVPVRQPISEPMYYEEELEEDNWNETSRSDRYDDYRDSDYPRENPYSEPEYAREYEYEDVEADAWADREKEEETPYNPPRVNIPQKQKTPEYEEESGY
jgi:sporulation protein YlmC with PRC-barrel domain